MINKAFILSGDAKFEVRCDSIDVNYWYRVRKVAEEFIVHGAQKGGRLHYLGTLYPSSGHLLRTTKTLKTRHTKIADSFRWVVSLLWWSGSLPDSYVIKPVETI